jgi:hypothetical protein
VPFFDSNAPRQLVFSRLRWKRSTAVSPGAAQSTRGSDQRDGRKATPGGASVTPVMSLRHTLLICPAATRRTVAQPYGRVANHYEFIVSLFLSLRPTEAPRLDERRLAATGADCGSRMAELRRRSHWSTKSSRRLWRHLEAVHREV